ncbi:MAG: hypothetical protein JXA77_19165 [Bacteroidales bacterium]|nr:hypothetical protein [Bacteroidales bacterium]MBN2821411.1 hypothetical protein [Bacteroidales bacterium]
MKNLFLVIVLTISSITLCQTSMVYNMKNGLPSQWITSVTEDDEGAIWVGTNKGVVKLTESNIITFNRKNGLPSNYVLNLFKDSKGNIWAGTNKGAAKLTDQNVEAFGMKQGLPHLYVTAINEDPDGNIYICTKGGVAKMNADENITVLKESDGLPKNCIHDIEFADATTWYGAFEGQVGAFDGANWNYYKQGSGYFNNLAFLVVFDVLTIGTLFSPSGMLLGLVLGLPIGYAIPYNMNFTNLAIDQSGNVWLAAWGGGLYRFDGANWTNFGKSQGLPKTIKYISDIACDEKGNIWASMNGGLLKQTVDGNWEIKTKKNCPLPHKMATTVYPDSQGNIWVGTRKGLLKLEN